MEFKISKRELVDVLKKVGTPVRAIASIPVLTGILVVAKDDGLHMTGSDSNVSVICKLPIDSEDGTLEILSEGAMVLPAREFIRIIRSFAEGEIEISSSENKVTIQSGKAKFSLNGIDAEQYPKFNLNFKESFKVKANQFTELLKKTGYSVSNLETRPILTGVNCFFNSSKLGAVSTDTHRLSRIYGVEVDGESEVRGFTIPSETVKIVPNLINSERVEINLNDNQIVFRTENMTIVSRLLSGTYPDTNRLIPNEFKTEMIVSNRGLRESLERAIVLAEDNPIVEMDYQAEDKGIFDSFTLSHNNRELGKSSEEVVVEEVKGENLEIAFNAKYAIDALKAINEEKVSVKFTSEMQPFVITPVGNESGVDTLKLILPVRRY